MVKYLKRESSINGEVPKGRGPSMVKYLKRERGPSMGKSLKKEVHQW